MVVLDRISAVQIRRRHDKDTTQLYTRNTGWSGGWLIAAPHQRGGTGTGSLSSSSSPSSNRCLFNSSGASTSLQRVFLIAAAEEVGVGSCSGFSWRWWRCMVVVLYPLLLLPSLTIGHQLQGMTMMITTVFYTRYFDQEDLRKHAYIGGHETCVRQTLRYCHFHWRPTHSKRNSQVVSFKKPLDG